MSPLNQINNLTRTEKLGIVIPLANEADTVENLLDRILRFTQKEDRVYCVVDNVSRDYTRDLLQKYSVRDDRVAVIWAPENRSVVDAYFRGYREALADGCEWILEMDGGLSHSPEQIPLFLEAMASGVDFAAGSRFVPGGSHTGNIRRRSISRGGSLLTNMLLGTRMADMTSGFQCFTRRALSHVVERGVTSRAHFFQTEIRTMMHTWNWVEVPIDYAAPSHGVGNESLSDAFSNLWRVFLEMRLARKNETDMEVRK